MSVRNPAYVTYRRRMGVALAGYLVALFAAARLLGHDGPVNALSLTIAAVPGVAVLGMIYAIARLLLELDDEFLRLLEVRKALVATGLLLSVAAFWGLLEMFTGVPRLPIFWGFPLWCLGLGVGSVVNRFTLGAGDCP